MVQRSREFLEDPESAPPAEDVIGSRPVNDDNKLATSGGGGGDGSELGKVLGFMRVLWAVTHGLEATSKRMASTLGVTGPQRLVLRIVGRFPGISAGRIAELLCVHPSTLTGVLKRLQEAKLLDRRHDPADARRAVFKLTEGGEQINTSRTGTVEAAVRRALSRVGTDDTDVVREFLTVLAGELEPDKPKGRASKGK